MLIRKRNVGRTENLREQSFGGSRASIVPSILSCSARFGCSHDKLVFLTPRYFVMYQHHLSAAPLSSFEKCTTG